jgi:cell division protein FtsL
MNVFTFVVCIVAIVMVADTIQKIYKVRQEKKTGDTQTNESQAHLDALEERIKVLERIVTENKYDLRREIDRL